MSMRFRIFVLASSLIIFLSLAGCANQQAQKRIVAFSDANKLTMQNIADAFSTVNRKHTEMQISRIIDDADSLECGKDTEFKGFLEPTQLNARLEVLEGLQAYSEKLALIMGNEQLDKFDEATKELGGKLQNMNNKLVKEDILSKGTFNEGEINIFTTAVNAIGRWIIEYKREKGVKEAVKSMHEPIENVCKLFAQEIGDSSKGGGLRAQLWQDYTDIIDRRCQFIRNSKKTLDPIQLRNEIKEMVSLEIERNQADITLTAIHDSLDKLRETHGKIEECFDKNTMEIDNLINGLLSEANRIRDFYKNLDKQ